ncbi:hypothetical protein I79_022041 [Cricetulus griseus]|uniref:Uncharacterized protein n=1 Tax=Cricetulus griseus TaxID=10029 RepID=G3IE97_CRIGR|nr:hypothetical protein I79_022041 [Cricetulus griseus]
MPKTQPLLSSLPQRIQLLLLRLSYTLGIVLNSLYILGASSIFMEGELKCL